jgi:N-acetyl-anhydromuramyl-L-alanine amidase AmpD
MAEVCKIILEITQEYELAFTEAQRKAVKQLQNDIHQRWLKPPRTEETQIPPLE